ncbi:MAG TPA: apolipoprotein N-acyltransferase, partial [Gaiellaceae bacterium]|nr:apolipoprotein N-acyltransferase [Gaiellaceae bacterium]
VAIGSDGAAVATAERSSRRGGRAALAVASGLLLAAAFPTLDLEPLAWVGLVPVLVAAAGLRPAPAFAVGWVAGFVFYLATTYWVAYTITRYTAVPLPVAVGILLIMAAALACYHGGFVAGMRWLERRRLPALWLAPALWVTLEWLRSWFFIGFPWATLGYSQYRYHDLVQIVEVTGVYGVSALLVLFNVVIAGVALTPPPRLRRLVPALVVLTLLVGGIPLWGRWRAAELARRPSAGTLRVAIVQGNVEQDHKWDPAYQADTLDRYRRLTADAATESPDLIVWPETATPFFFQLAGPLRDDVLATAVDTGVHLVFGSPAFRQDRSGVVQELNRAYLVSPAGRELGSYDKIVLVPFGEYVPYARVLFFVTQIVEAVGTIVPGLDATVFHLPAAAFGVPICYEDVFPALTRRFVAGGADFLVNVTNDAWYGPTSAPHQHLAQATLRAVENRVPLVRAANTGISAIVEPDGRIRWRSALFETLYHVDTIAWPGVRTFYTRFGDVFAWACALICLVAAGWGLARRRLPPD